MNRLQINFEVTGEGEENTGNKGGRIASSPLPINSGMIWFKRDKEKERFYLLAGMGGKAMRRKNKIFLAWSIFAAAVVSFALALTLFLLNIN